MNLLFTNSHMNLTAKLCWLTSQFFNFHLTNEFFFMLRVLSRTYRIEQIIALVNLLTYFVDEYEDYWIF